MSAKWRSASSPGCGVSPAQGRLVLLGDPGRAYLPQSGLRELARYRVPTSRELEDADTREAIVFEVLAG